MIPFWRDQAFGLAFLAGPICWAVLYFVLPSGPLNHQMLAVLTLVLLMPVLEELVFRGGLQSFLLTKAAFQKQFAMGLLAKVSLANVCCSVVFALFHLLNQPPLWAALVFLPSLVFGWALEKFNSVVPCVVLHCWYNAGFVLLFVNTSAI